MQHVAVNAFLKTAGVAALEGRHLGRNRACLPGVVILFLKEQIDLAGRAAQGRLLEQEGEGFYLLEIGRQQQIGHTGCFAQVVAKVSEKLGAILVKRLLDFFASEVGAFVLVVGNAEVGRDRLQTVGSHFARADIVELHQQIGVHHGATRQIATRKIHHALRDLQPAVTEFRQLAETAPSASDLVAFRAEAKKIEVEFENVMPFDRIRIELGESGVELFE